MTARREQPRDGQNEWGHKTRRNLSDANARSTKSILPADSCVDRSQSINTMGILRFRLCAVENIRKSLDRCRSRVDVSMRSITVGLICLSASDRSNQVTGYNAIITSAGYYLGMVTIITRHTARSVVDVALTS